MAETDGDKTEAPTPKRRQEAREQGNVPRSTDLTSAVMMLGGLILLNYYGAGIVGALKNVMDRLLGRESLANLDPSSASGTAYGSIMAVGAAIAPMFIGAVVIAVTVNVAQVGLSFNMKKLQPNLGALNPLKGAGKLFKGKGVAQLVLNLLKLTLVSWTAYSAVHGRMGEIVGAMALEFGQIVLLGASLVYWIGMRVGIVLLILALVDYAYQRFRVEKELKMTKQEVKEEMKRMDGDPQVKQRRKQLAMQMLDKKLAQDVPTADVIVTNPTHYAVALKYDSSMTAPRVVAKGQDFIALRIRELAVGAWIPIVERPPLARSLYAAVDVGEEIPEGLYAAVAEILAYVYELSGRRRKTVSAN
ncbi:MAG: flagellar biosynthesis protein FlhB [Phycisphaerae bacterium]